MPAFRSLFSDSWRGRSRLLADLVMPGADGFDLALHAESIRPDFRSLFMRYYDEQAACKASSTAESFKSPSEPASFSPKSVQALSG
jgi:hypothetical protein